MEKRFISIGYDFPGHSEFYHSYRTNQSLLDGDIIVFQPDLSGYNLNYSGDSYFRGKKCLNNDSSFDIQEDTSHWKKEITVALENGKTVFVFLVEFEEVYIFTGRKEYSGTGRNRQTTNIVNGYDNYKFFPINLPTIIPKHGEGVLFTGNATFSTFWSEFKAYIKYDSYLDEKIPNAIFLTRTGEKTIGALFKIGKGNLVLLPPLKYDEKKFIKYGTNGESNWTTEAVRFGKRLLKNFVEIDKSLKKESESTPPPEWLVDEKFSLQEEIKLKDKIEDITKKVDELITSKNELTLQLDQSIKLKDLLFEKSKNLENSINAALKILGYKAENFNSGDLELDHIIISPEGDRFIGEAEGKDTSAINIDKFRQLSLNIHEDAQREEVTELAIGILFGNGHRLKNPTEREEQFTTKCIAVAKTSNSVLIRTADLFNVAKYILESGDENFAKKCRESIKSSIGNIVTFPPLP